MTRRFTLVTLCLTATVSGLIGLVIAGSLTPSRAVSRPVEPMPAAPPRSPRSPGAGVVNFADVAQRINPAVVNIDATSRTRGARQGPSPRVPPDPGWFDSPGDPTPDREFPRRGAGSGFVIDRDGHILTNHHVIEAAERVTVKLADGRSVRARIVGSDPDTDIALLKVESPTQIPVAPLGNSDTLRVGEWVCAIGNPLAYEHTVTVGVVSYIGRKLFDPSLDNYIQTDAAINFGNSGGPLINADGEVIGINAAISSRASNIGFAVPINQAKGVLRQLKERGRVSRGYVGVSLKDLDADLQHSLNLPSVRGALVQDVTPGSPGERAGVRAYDVIVGVDGRPVASNEALIKEIARREPGTAARLRILRDGHEQTVIVKLAERPARDQAPKPQDEGRPGEAVDAARRAPLGIGVREISAEWARRLALPKAIDGVVITEIEPMSPAYDAQIERGQVILEVNRRAIRSVDDFYRMAGAAKPGDALALYLYKPNGQRELRAVRVDSVR
jgi:serine protease Do